MSSKTMKPISRQSFPFKSLLIQLVKIMKCVLVFVSLLTSSLAAGHGRSGYSKGAGYSSGGQSAGGKLVPASVQSRQQIEFRDVPSSGSFSPATVEVGSQPLPLQILFKSSSSNLNIQQAHDSAQGSVQESSSEDEPHRLIHQVKKPIIQEVHEVITPFRKITQEIQPVQEEIQTILAREVGSVGGGAGSGRDGNSGRNSLSLGSARKGLGSGLKGKSSGSYSSGVKLSSKAY